ncbi:unnamed protein product [Natator depressus]
MIKTTRSKTCFRLQGNILVSATRASLLNPVFGCQGTKGTADAHGEESRRTIPKSQPASQAAAGEQILEHPKGARQPLGDGMGVYGTRAPRTGPLGFQRARGGGRVERVAGQLCVMERGRGCGGRGMNVVYRGEACSAWSCWVYIWCEDCVKVMGHAGMWCEGFVCVWNAGCEQRGACEA